MILPLIGIAANLTCVDGGNKGSTTRVYINDSYVKSVELGGGVPVGYIVDFEE